MIRGMYTAISGLITLEAKQAVITNNLTNISTPGFKPDDLIISQFDKVMMANKDNGFSSFKTLGGMSIGSKIDSTRIKFDQGSLKQTDKFTDFALIGDGFFTVTQGGQEYYTRDGAFVIDEAGNLKTSTGASVMGINLRDGNYEPINVGLATNISVEGYNNLIVDGQSYYRIRISNFQDKQVIEKVGNNLYRGEGATEILTSRVRNNSIEVSEVDPAIEMVNLTNTLRSFESTMKVLGYLDESLRISANDIGKV